MSYFAGRIDAHQHFFDPARFHYPWMTGSEASLARRWGPEELRPALRATGVTGTVAVQACHDEAETRWLLELCEAEPAVRGVVGWVDLTRLDVGDRLSSLRTGRGGQHLVGIRHQVHDEADPAFLGRHDVRRGIEAVLGAGLTFDLLVRSREMPAAVDVARAFPEGRFVLDHLGKPPTRSGDTGRWLQGLKDLASCPNVVAKISGLVTEADRERWTPIDVLLPAQVAVELFGPERLMVGSDWPVCTLAGSYEEVVTVISVLVDGWSADERQSVWSGTARRVYCLADPLLHPGSGGAAQKWFEQGGLV